VSLRRRGIGMKSDAPPRRRKDTLNCQSAAAAPIEAVSAWDHALVAKWLTETKAELATAIYFPHLGFDPITPKQDFRVIRRRTTKQPYALVLEMVIEEGEDVVIGDPSYSGALKLFSTVFLRKKEGNVAETIVPGASDIHQVSD
jgi:hypothetical protein